MADATKPKEMVAATKPKAATKLKAATKPATKPEAATKPKAMIAAKERGTELSFS